MASAEYLRQEAERYRKLAAKESSAPLRDRLLGYVRQCEALAEVMEETADRAAPPGAQLRHQVMQQQQQKEEE